MDFSKLGERIKQLRKEKGWSLEVFADKTKIDKSMLSRYENGSGMEVYNLMVIAYTLETSLDYLVFGDGPRVLNDKKWENSSFGEQFVKSISFLSKNFNTYLANVDQDNYDPDRKEFVVSFHNVPFNYSEIASSIADLYTSGDYAKANNFSKYEKEILDKYAKEINERIESQNKEWKKIFGKSKK